MLRAIISFDMKCFRYVVYKEKLLSGRLFEEHRSKNKVEICILIPILLFCV